MRVNNDGQKRPEAARKWMVEEAGGIPSFCGAYTAGSTNWLPEDAELGVASDLDIMVVLGADVERAIQRAGRAQGVGLDSSGDSPPWGPKKSTSPNLREA